MEKNEQVADENFDEIQESDTTNWKAETTKLREKAIRQREKTGTLRGTIKEMEAKLAEFEKTANQQTKSDDKLVKRLNTALMRSYGYMEPDEVEVVEKWQKETGKDIEELLSHQYLSQGLKGEIEILRTAKANDAATKNIQGGSGKGTDIKTDPQYWIGRNEAPPNTPEYRAVRQSIQRIMSEKETGMKSL